MTETISIKIKLASLIFISSLFLSACSNPFDSLADQINEFISDEEESTESSSNAESDNESSDSDEALEESAEAQSSHTESAETEEELYDYQPLQGAGEETTLEEGEYVVGRDIEEGHYRVTSDGGHGNFSVVSEDEKQLNNINGILSDDSGDDESSNEMIVYLFEGHEVRVYAPESLTLTPYTEDEMLNTLPIGQYIVGEDVEPGTYEIHSEINESYYYFDIYNSTHQERKVRLQLGDPIYGGAENHLASFEEGDIIVVNAPEVELINQD